MDKSGSRGIQGVLRFTREALAIVISIISFVISTVNVYVTNLRSPDLSMIVAPYIKQVVDNKSLNETFFIPVTVVNQGAKPGSVLSFELVVTYVPTGDQETYYAQYFTNKDNPELLGSFFAPLNLAGYSAESHTLCFYPPGVRDENLFSKTGEYEFAITGVAANVKGGSQKRIRQVFKIDLTENMYDQMQSQSDHEYPYPIRIETGTGTNSILDFLRNLGK